MSAAVAAAGASSVISLSLQLSQPKCPATMATAHVLPFFLLPCYSANGAIDGLPVSRRFLRRRRHRLYRHRVSSSTDTSTSSPPLVGSEKPKIELEFVDPKPGADGYCARQRAVAESGEKLLRNIMVDNKIELYAAYGKVMNCGGGGSCGTCIVEIIDGQDLLNERTNTENRYLKKKPESWRLACQTIVGNKENAGKVTVQRLPQWKK